MIFTYIFSSDELIEMSENYHSKHGIIINDYNITDVYVGF